MMKTTKNTIITHDFFMREALKQANKALHAEEVPIGAIIVDEQNNIIARAYNKVEHHQAQTSHAEVIAIEKACKKLGTWRLNGCRIYVTLEPCLMCFGLIQLSRMKEVVFGARSTLFGVSTHNISAFPSYAQSLQVTGEVMGPESLALLRKFFTILRLQRRECYGRKRVFTKPSPSTGKDQAESPSAQNNHE